MSEITVQLANQRFWNAANKARAAGKLSARSVSMLEACRSSTYEKPIQKISFAQAGHLRDKGLLDFRMFDKKLGAGGHYITEAGRMALDFSYQSAIS